MEAKYCISTGGIMKTGIIAVALMFAIFLPGLSHAEPLGIRYFKIGMHKSIAVLKETMECVSDYCFVGDFVIKDHKVELALKFTDEQELSIITAKYNGRFHKDMLLAISEKYGEPTEHETVEWKNAAGAKFDNKVFRWVLPEGTITAWSIAKKLSEAQFMIVGSNYRDSLNREQERKKALPGL
jgi:hypothetical protein